MGATLLITLREGIEAALIISIMLAYLRRLERTDGAKPIWIGVGVAVAVSIVVGAVIFFVGAEFEGTAEEIFEGTVSLIAVAVLTWMIFWMRRQGSQIKSELHGKIDSALGGGTWALALLAFVVVVREGIETALFLFATAKATSQAGGGWGQLLGAVIGLSLAIVLGYLLYQGAVKINLRTFFKVTGALILVVAAGLFAFGIAEFQEAGVLPFLGATAFDISGFLSDETGLGAILRALFGYQADPTQLEVIAWVGYLLVTGWFFFRPVSPETAPIAPIPAQTASAAASS